MKEKNGRLLSLDLLRGSVWMTLIREYFVVTAILFLDFYP